LDRETLEVLCLGNRNYEEEGEDSDVFCNARSMDSREVIERNKCGVEKNEGEPNRPTENYAGNGE
jgi:hypothetical protein